MSSNTQEMTTMTMAQAMLADLIDRRIVLSTKEWGTGSGKRTYIRLAGYDASYRGCQTHQFYLDVSGRLVDVKGHGRTPRSYDASADAVREAFAKPEDFDVGGVCE
jgi:hypothetical protein